jgi:hypothetical protein
MCYFHVVKTPDIPWVDNDIGYVGYVGYPPYSMHGMEPEATVADLMIKVGCSGPNMDRNILTELNPTVEVRPRWIKGLSIRVGPCLGKKAGDGDWKRMLI